MPHATHAIRLVPGDDLKESILKYVRDARLTSAWIVTAVGSLSSARVRLANYSALLRGSSNDVYDAPDERFEIVSLVGTISAAGASCHLHCALGDKRGEVIGGHVLDGCVVFTTCEIVLGSDHEVTFTREHDERTGFDELVVSGRSNGDAEDEVAAETSAKRRRRARQLAAAEREREEREERGEKEPVRGLFGWLVNVVAPRPRDEEAGTEGS
jgi:uncharacterized protein